MIRKLNKGLGFPLDVLVQDDPAPLNAMIGKSYRNARVTLTKKTPRLRHRSHS